MSDRFRKDCKVISQTNVQLILRIKEFAEQIEALMVEVSNREMSLAITNLEQAVMWARKAIVIHDEIENAVQE